MPKVMASLPYAISFPMGSTTRIAINESYRDVQRVLNAIALAALVPALLAVCMMRNVNLAKEDQALAGVEGPVVILGRANLTEGDDDEGEDGDSIPTGERETSALLGVPAGAGPSSRLTDGSA